ncbi:MAG: NAD(P)/FAD-dependent oxidoreductase [Promethearchaeota archaeon]
MNKFDLIIIGAGAAGSIAAYFGAKKGFNVCLIDGKPRDKIGDKICGDGIGSQIFDFLKIPHPKKGEYLNVIDGAKLYPPDTNYCLTIKDTKQSGYIIDRLVFGQRLVEDAVSEGAHLFDQTHAISLIYDKTQVIGVTIKSKTTEEKELYAKVVIDASGFHTQFRKQTDIPYLTKNIDPHDYIICYREILRLKKPIVFDLKYISIYMGNIKAPGGYIWYFPRNENEVNLGFGIADKYKHKLLDYYQKYVYKPFIGNEPCFKITGGSGLVSVCKPLWTGVGDGILFAGDAAMHVNPITGGGLVSSMQAGFFAVNTFEKAMDMEIFDTLSLWKYNELYQKSIGAEFAPLDLLRLAFQKWPNDFLNFTLKKQLITGEEVSGITATGEMSLPFRSALGKLIRGISKPNILLELNFLRKEMQEIKSLYMRYPSTPVYLKNWIKKVEFIYERVRKRVGGPL